MILGEKAQVSAELIIILAAVIAVALLVVSQLSNTSTDASKVIEKKASKIFKEIDDIE
ncbi:MAG: hypothetical protein ABH821_05625 [archaeon]